MQKINRKKRKAAYIRVKNLMRQYPNCAYGGDFFCNHYFGENASSLWVDFKFKHGSRKQWVSVSMRTIGHEAIDIISDKASVMTGMDENVKVPFVSVSHGEHMQKIREKIKRYREKCIELALVPVPVAPKIAVVRNGISIVLDVVVNAKNIDEHVIRNFIRYFRSLGEPTTPGWKLEGEPIEINAAELFSQNA